MALRSIAQEMARRTFTSSNGFFALLSCMNHMPPIATFVPVTMPGVVASSAIWCGGGALMMWAWPVLRYATRAVSSGTILAIMRSQAGTPLRQ